MPWKSSSVMDERIKFVIRASLEGVNFSALCRSFGISRPTGYRWLNRYRDSGSVSRLGELSRRPHHSPGRTPDVLEQRVIALRRKYGWGARKLRILLLGKGFDLKVTTINRILKRNNLVPPKDLHRSATRRFERDCPNELWQMDFKGDYASGQGRCYPLSVLDDHSRYGIALYALPGKDTETVKASLIETFDNFGIPVAMLMDHGIPWWSPSNNHGLTRLSVSLIDQGIKLCFSGLRHPQTQGKVERFHRTLNESVTHKGHPHTLSGWQKCFQDFLYEYNYIRPHEALQMATPSKLYKSSGKAYNPNPREWEYPEGSEVERLTDRGWLGTSRQRYFVCEALAGKRVRVERIDNKLIVSYRHMYIREIDKDTRKTISLLTPIEKY
jgi:transposase InsO family protein